MTARVFVAGASGVLGRRVVPALVAAGHTVTANVRDDDARRAAVENGASAVTVDLFSPAATEAIGRRHDVIVNVATSIPTGASAVRRSAWRMNDRLRTEAAANLAASAGAAGGRYIGESITFPYADGDDEWLDESTERTFFSGNASTVDAEAAAASVVDAGGVGVVLRFAQFFADDSSHVETFRAIGRRGMFAVTGRSDAFISWVHVDDAASAVVASLVAPAGTYNVAEPDPVRRLEHREALARAVGRRRLRTIPPRLSQLGGGAVDSISRSHRISSTSLTAATGWEPRVAVVDCWS